MLLWPGVCIVHEAFSEKELMKLKAQHPGAPVAAHPECPPAILDHADYVGSTSGILQFAKTFPGDTLIVATEPHIIHQMEKALPEKTFIGAPGADGNCNCNICPYMALNTMEKLYTALRDLTPRIEIEEGLRLGAKRSLDRMLEMASGTVGHGRPGAFVQGLIRPTGSAGAPSPLARATAKAAASSAMPATSIGASVSPKASHPASAATAGWVSSARPMASGGKCRSENTSSPCPMIWLDSASATIGPQLCGQTGSPCSMRRDQQHRRAGGARPASRRHEPSPLRASCSSSR